MNNNEDVRFSTLEEALANDDLTPVNKRILEETCKQTQLIYSNKKKDFIRLTPPNKDAQRYTEIEKQKIYEEAEKGGFLLFLKVLANPNQKVRRLVFPKRKIIKTVSCIPNTLDELETGTFLLSKMEGDWKLSLLLRKNKQAELKEIDITHIKGLEEALSKLPTDNMPEQYSENDIKNIARLVPLYPIDSYEDISGETDYFQCLTSAQVTYLIGHFPHRVPIFPNFDASINDVWVSSIEADIFLGKSNRNELEKFIDKNKRVAIESIKEEKIIKKKRSSKIDLDLKAFAFHELTLNRNHPAFVKMMKESYILPPGKKPTLENTYEVNDTMRLIYLVLENKKETLHYSVMGENGKLIPKHISLGAFNRYFNEYQKSKY